MDQGWATVRGRAQWATALGVVVALALIGASLIALNRSVLSFDGWSTEPAGGSVEQTLPPDPDTAIGIRSTRGVIVLPGISGPGGSPFIPVLPSAGGGTGGDGTVAATAGGGAGGAGGGPGDGGTGGGRRRGGGA